MQVIKRIEIQYFRSIYNIVIKDFSDLNMLSEKNDVGKSNILKALNLFFNNEVESGKEFIFADNFNLSRLQEVRKDSVKGKQFIKIKVTFDRGNSCVKTLPRYFSITKKWYRNDKFPSDVKNDIELRMKSEKMEYNERRCKTSLTMFLNRIRFYYIPAIKDKRIFDEMVLCLRETIYNDKLATDKKLQIVLDDTAQKVGKAADDLNDEFYKVTKIKSEIIPPNSVAELYKSLKIITKTDSGNINILDRGDGIRVRYIPSILNYIAKNTSNICIWAYEEPENSLEYNLAIKMADDFKKYSGDSQIIITTHSPAFIGMEGGNIKLFRCYKNEENTLVLDILEATQQEELEEELGYMQLLNEQNRVYKEKVIELQNLRTESTMLRESLEKLKKPIVMTEGKTDVEILKNAWKRLYNYECPFIIKSCNTFSEEDKVSAAGCAMLAETLSSWKYDATNLLIGVFDNDDEGQKAFNLGKNFEPHKEGIIRHKNGNAYAMLLPSTEEMEPFVRVKNLCIEFYFDYECLSKKVNGMGLELEPQYIIKLCNGIETGRDIPNIDTQLYLYKPKKNTKAYFAEKIVPTLPDDKFCNFKILFEQILEIIDISYSNNEVKENYKELTNNEVEDGINTDSISQIYFFEQVVKQ